MGNRNYRTTIDARGRYGTAFFCFLTLDGILGSSLKESRSNPMPERQDFCQTGTGKQPLEPINGGPKLENYQRIYMWELREAACRTHQKVPLSPPRLTGTCSRTKRRPSNALSK